jgi:hypothetical protein
MPTAVAAGVEVPEAEGVEEAAAEAVAALVVGVVRAPHSNQRRYQCRSNQHLGHQRGYQARS